MYLASKPGIFPGFFIGLECGAKNTCCHPTDDTGWGNHHVAEGDGAGKKWRIQSATNVTLWCKDSVGIGIGHKFY